METAGQQPYYVQRKADRLALEAIRHRGVTIVLKGPRQVGKTLLLERIADEVHRQHKLGCTLDFQLLDAQLLLDAHALYRTLFAAAAAAAGLPEALDNYPPEGGASSCTDAFEHYLLPRLTAPLVLMLDSTDRLTKSAVRSEFFGMLRAWSDYRSIRPIWRQLDLVIVTAIDLPQLIGDPFQSPFNVGLTITLDDFTPQETATLNAQYGRPLTPTQLRRLASVTGGHPFLVRRALHLVAAGTQNADDLLGRAADERGPFGDHLRSQLFRLYHQSMLAQAMRQVLHGDRCDEQSSYLLQHAGLVRAKGRKVVPRCQLYATYLGACLA